MNNATQVIENYLKRNGITSQKVVNEIKSGFDLSRPVYEQRIFVNDRLFQYVRNPSSSFNGIGIGRWFSLKEATMDDLAIFSGGSGRSLTEFKVKYTIAALEGTANKMKYDWSWSGGGKGGATQIFIPKKMFYAIEVMGTFMK